MTSQTESGKALEYALLEAVRNKTDDGKQQVTVLKDSSYNVAKDAFYSQPADEQNKYSKAAVSAVKHIVTLEPRLENPIADRDSIEISIQPDQAGQSGDVRDVMMIRSKDSWQLGFSAKNEHNAVKHQRLSAEIDFGKAWFGLKCSKEYMQMAKSIFGSIHTMKHEHKKSGQGDLLWSDIPNKVESVYLPVLDAFEKELCRLVDENEDVPSLLMKYLLGKNDFYKIMKFDQYITIQGYNLNGTLNNPAGTIRSRIKIKKLKFPTRIIGVDRNGKNTTMIVFDRGWQTSFRIHNASSKAEPSLKFDVRLEGMPPSLYSHDDYW